MKIKRKHQELLKAIRKNPNVTLKELQAVIGANSIPIVDYHLKSMMADGLLKKNDKCAKEIIGKILLKKISRFQMNQDGAHDNHHSICAGNRAYSR